MAKDNRFKGIIRTSYLDSTPWWPEEEKAPEGAPNVLFVVLDDTGFSQLECYGSTVPTPNMNSLADEGLRYNNFHVCALCSPTRASLLSGCNNHTVGMGNLSAVDLGYPVFRGQIDPKYGLLSETLHESGYATFAVGKWHLVNASSMGGAGPFDHWPLGKGFDKYYGFLNGATSQFYPELVQDNTIIDPPKTPEEGYHLSEDLVDHAINYIATEKSAYPNKPFFCYLAFGAMHSPYQAPQEYIDKFKGAFDMGYDEYRKIVFRRQKEMGLIPQDAVLPGSDRFVREWSTLTEREKKIYAKYMEVFAAYLNYTDEQLGRLLDYLKKIGQYENTLIVLLSDNGAAADGGSEGGFNEQYHTLSHEWEPPMSDEKIEKIGTADSYSIYPAGWAWAGNTPLRFYKSFCHAGGIKVPCIISYPDKIKDHGGIRTQYHYVTDLYQTVLDVCGVEQPEFIKGVRQEEKHGISMKYTFDDKDAEGQRHVQYSEMVGNRAIWCDGWKAVADHTVSPTFEEDKWELYNTNEDYTEVNDLAEKYPEKLRELVEMWWVEAGKYGVLPMLESLLKHIEGFDASKVLKFTPQNDFKHCRFYPEMDKDAAVPKFTNKSYSIKAVAEYNPGDEGVFYSCGSTHGGYALYIEDGKLHYYYNYLADRNTDVVSDTEITEGKHEFRFDFTLIEPGKGTGQLYIDGEITGKEVVFNDSLFSVMMGFGVGRYSCGPINVAHHGKKNFFAYTGKLEYVDLDMERPENDSDRVIAYKKQLENE